MWKLAGEIPLQLNFIANQKTLSNMSYLNEKLKNRQLSIFSLVATTTLLCFLTSCGSNDNSAALNNSTATNALDSNAALIDKTTSGIGGNTAGLGPFIKQKMTCGAELNIPENGCEAKLVAFVEDAGKPADEDTWFTMDRLFFETGKSRLDMKKSIEQLQNIVEILKCYPKVQLKIAGFAEDASDKNSNQELSTERATTVKATLIGLGVAPARLEEVGMSDQFPASKTTGVGRTQNLWIDVQVISK